MTHFTTINPSTEQVIADYEWMSNHTIESRLSDAVHAQKNWAQIKPKHRVTLLTNLQKNLTNHRLKLAKLMAAEMGKPLNQGLAEIDKCANLCAYYAEHTEQYLRSEIIKTEYARSLRTFFPIGIILGIMPWNFPFWQVMRYAIPNLMAGNGIVLKHSHNVTGCALAIEQLFKESEFLDGLFNTLIIDLPETTQLIHHPAIAGVTLTGSNRAGQSVAMEAGKAIKKVVLELGGSDPYLILADADIELAAQCCVQSRLNNTGQVCIAAKRILVDKKIAPFFTEHVQALAHDYRYGDPFDKTTQMGPIARNDIRNTVHHQVQRVIQEGAHCLLGGKQPEGTGYFYPATVLSNVSPHSLITHEELFGPVLCITAIDSEEQGITLANQTPYGLSAAVFTKSPQYGERIAERIDAGVCAVNTMVSSDPRLPFGGTKQSGFGRELSLEGMREFVNIKTVIINR